MPRDQLSLRHVRREGSWTIYEIACPPDLAEPVLELLQARMDQLIGKDICRERLREFGIPSSVPLHDDPFVKLELIVTEAPTSHSVEVRA